MLPGLSTKCVPALPGLPFVAVLATGPPPPAGQPAWLKWEVWVLAPALSSDDNGHGVYIPEINFPKHRVVFLNTLKRSLLHTGVHVKTEWE